MQSTASSFVTGMQVNPDSFLHVDEQPSPSTALPSSQSSPVSMLPFPQLVEQACVLPEALRQVGSLVQVLEQPVPSPLKRPFGPVQPVGSFVGSVPQSQASPASFTPLPQMAVVHAPAIGAPVLVVGQVEAGSTWQVLEQPSPLVVLLSSHFSLPSMTPSPQIGMQGFPGTGQRPTGLDGQAVARAAVAAGLVPVVAGLGCREDAVAADVVAHAGLADGRTDPSFFDLTERRATVAAHLVAVVALLAGIERRIAAKGGIARGQPTPASMVKRPPVPLLPPLPRAVAAAAGAAACHGFDTRAASKNEPENNRRDT